MNESIIAFQEAYFAKHGRYVTGMGTEWDQKNAALDLAARADKEAAPVKPRDLCSKGSGIMGQYGKTSLFVDGLWVDERVAVWTAANGPVPKGKAVGNTCYNKWCVTLSHLETFGKRF